MHRVVTLGEDYRRDLPRVSLLSQIDPTVQVEDGRMVQSVFLFEELEDAALARVGSVAVGVAGEDIEKTEAAGCPDSLGHPLVKMKVERHLQQGVEVGGDDVGLQACFQPRSVQLRYFLRGGPRLRWHAIRIEGAGQDREALEFTHDRV